MGMKQQSLATAGFELSTKRTRKREFLDEMNLLVPWALNKTRPEEQRKGGRCIRSVLLPSHAV